MDVIDRQILDDALVRYINYWHDLNAPMKNDMQRREVIDFIVRCEELRQHLLEVS
jgi:hypothetical protein